LGTALALTAVLLFGGGWLLKDASEGAIQAWVLLSIVVGFIVLHAGDKRQKRS
jgi:hypothetical protein